MRHVRPLCIITLAAISLAGCVSPGGSGYSDDKHCFVSTNLSPKTVSILDTRTHQIVWTTEVPVGQELVVKFFEGSDPKAYMPDLMKYGFAKAYSTSAAWVSSIPVPSAECRRVDWTIRTAPEFPAGEKSAPAAAPTTTTTTATPKKSADKKPEMIDLPDSPPPAKTNPEPVREVK